MADPTKPVISYSYTGFQQEQQENPFPGTQLDADLARLTNAFSDTIDALKDVRRADGALQNGIVTNDSLSTELTIGVRAASDWTTGKAYTVNDTVYHEDAIYRCLEAHTSGTFAVDLAAGKWEVVADFSELTTNAAASAAAAAASATTASTKAGEAAASASAASASETNAASSASAASTSETNAASSAVSASDEADAAEDWAIQAEDTPVPVASGGDGATTFSALHWAAKSAASAATIPTIQGGDAGKQIFVKNDESGYELGSRNVRFDAAQSLNGTQQAQARKNTGLDDTTAAPNVGDTWQWNGTIWVPRAAREVLTAARTYHVNASTGSDSNEGLDSGDAFATIQKAFDVVGGLDLSTYEAVISAANATYSENVLVDKAWLGGSKLTLSGDTLNPSNVVLSGTGQLIHFNTALPCPVYLEGIDATTSGGNTIRVEAACIVSYGNMIFGAAANAHLVALAPGANIQCHGDYEIDGGAQRHWQTTTPAYIRCQGRTITLTGTPNFSVEFASAARVGSMLVSSNTFSGAATGKRYSATLNGVIDVQGAGSTYLPGDSAGSTATGGQYA